MDVREFTEKNLCTLRLRSRPFVGGHHQKPLAPCKQFRTGLVVLKPFGAILCILSYQVAVSINERATILLQLSHHETMLLPSIGITCHLFTTVLTTHFLKSLKAKLLMMGSVKRAHGIRKASFHYTVHTL